MPNSLGFYTDRDRLFRGVEKFKELLQEGKLKPTQLIRVYNYGRRANDEEHYTLDTKGRLWNNEGVETSPDQALSGPNGWSFEGYSFDRIPKSELEKVVQ
jgi:hypothetical protein